MAELWVVDASPLIALARANALDLLTHLSTSVVVPNAVVAEVAAGPDDPARRALLTGFGLRRDARISERIAEWGLGDGESAVLALAAELGATAVLDDRSARRAAAALGVPVIGTVGVVLRAKLRSVIPEARPVFRTMVDAGLYVDLETLRALLASVGESWD